MEIRHQNLFVRVWGFPGHRKWWHQDSGVLIEADTHVHRLSGVASVCVGTLWSLNVYFCSRRRFQTRQERKKKTVHSYAPMPACVQMPATQILITHCCNQQLCSRYHTSHSLSHTWHHASVLSAHHKLQQNQGVTRCFRLRSGQIVGSAGWRHGKVVPTLTPALFCVVRDEIIRGKWRNNTENGKGGGKMEEMEKKRKL